MYWITMNEFILAILAAVIVGGYRRAAPTTINQSIVTTQIGWIVHWVSASAQTSPNANSNQSVNANSINQSTNQSIIISNKSINQNWIQSITQKCKQIFNQSINQSILSTFKFMKWMKLQNIGCTPPFVLGCAENATCTCHTRPWIIGAFVGLQPPPRECPVPWWRRQYTPTQMVTANQIAA